MQRAWRKLVVCRTAQAVLLRKCFDAHADPLRPVGEGGIEGALRKFQIKSAQNHAVAVSGFREFTLRPAMVDAIVDVEGTSRRAARLRVETSSDMQLLKRLATEPEIRAAAKAGCADPPRCVACPFLGM